MNWYQDDRRVLNNAELADKIAGFINKLPDDNPKHKRIVAYRLKRFLLELSKRIPDKKITLFEPHKGKAKNWIQEYEDTNIHTTFQKDQLPKTTGGLLFYNSFPEVLSGLVTRFGFGPMALIKDLETYTNKLDTGGTLILYDYMKPNISEEASFRLRKLNKSKNLLKKLQTEGEFKDYYKDLKIINHDVVGPYDVVIEFANKLNIPDRFIQRQANVINNFLTKEQWISVINSLGFELEVVEEIIASEHLWELNRYVEIPEYQFHANKILIVAVKK